MYINLYSFFMFKYFVLLSMLLFFTEPVPRQIQYLSCNVSLCVCVFLLSPYNFCCPLDSVAVAVGFMGFSDTINTPEEVIGDR